jgi:hypothetical protein
MNAWINEMAEAVGMGRTGLDLSLSDMSMLVPDARVLWIAAAAVVFCIVAGCQDAWSDDRQDGKFDHHQEWNR